MTINQLVITDDGPTLILMLGGGAAIRCGRRTAQACLEKARRDLADLRRTRTSMPAWWRTGDAGSRRYILNRIKVCRAELAKCERQLALLREIETCEAAMPAMAEAAE